MTTLRIIGIGSPFAGDRVGWQIVDALQQSCITNIPSSFTVSCIKTDRPGAGLVNLMSGVDRVVLIDAMVSGSPPGTLRKFTGRDIESMASPVSSHGLGVAEALGLAAALGDTPEIILYGIEIPEPHSEGRAGSENRDPFSPEQILHTAREIAADLSRPAD